MKESRAERIEEVLRQIVETCEAQDISLPPHITKDGTYHIDRPSLLDEAREALNS